ncbi:MAG: hypothetical protein V3T86_07505 [Planctomycetota bacterium]
MANRFERVEWIYDGLKGKIIPWTLENGGTSHDPSAQVFVVTRSGLVQARCPNGNVYSGGSLAKWLGEEAKKHEKAFPRFKVPFDPAEVTIEATDDGAGVATCEALDAALSSGKPVICYFGREPGLKDDKAIKKQLKACRKIEKAAFGSKKAAAEAKGWTLLRFDLSEKSHARLAKYHGVEAAPAVLLFAAGKKEPVDISKRLKGANLAFHLKKGRAAE